MTARDSERSPDKPDKPRPPVFRELLREESEQLLARNHVGRIAFTFHDRVDIEPIHYVFDSEWIYGRTGPGKKLDTLAHNRWVAFEVDEVKGFFDWRSVVVKGAFYHIDPDAPTQRDAAYERGIERLRSIIPETLSEGDPAPTRRSVFRIHLDEVTGREASTG